MRPLADSRLLTKTRVGAKICREELHPGNCCAQSRVASDVAGSTTAGGLGVRIHGNTEDLLGAVIAGDADPLKNHLSTGTLSFSDIQNQSSYDAHSGGFSAGASTDDGGANYSTHGNTSGRNTGGGSPMPSQDNHGSDGAITHSGISAGTISVTDPAIQLQDIASLNRDTSNTNGTIARLPHVNRLLDQQADRMSASGAAGEAVSRRIGDYADEQTRATGNPEWDEGGTNRTALHIAGGALIAGLGGGSIGSAAQGAAGAGIAAWAAGDLNRLANATRNSLGGGDAALAVGNVLSNVVAGAGGFLIGGPTGAFTASNTDLYNRSTGNGDGQGSTSNSALGWIGDQLASAGRGAENLANQFAALVNVNGPQGPYVDPGDLNGPSGNSKPPAAGGLAALVPVCAVPPLCAAVPVVTPGTSWYVPSNAIFNSENSDGGDARQANPSKADSPVWHGLDSAGNGVKTDGKLFYEWDYTHNDIEVYNKHGVHLGSMDPVSGDMYKDAVPGRKLNSR